MPTPPALLEHPLAQSRTRSDCHERPKEERQALRKEVGRDQDMHAVDKLHAWIDRCLGTDCNEKEKNQRRVVLMMLPSPSNDASPSVETGVAYSWPCLQRSIFFDCSKCASCGSLDVSPSRKLASRGQKKKILEEKGRLRDCHLKSNCLPTLNSSAQLSSALSRAEETSILTRRMRPALHLAFLVLAAIGGAVVVEASWTSGRRSAGPSWTTEAVIEVGPVSGGV